MVPRTELTLYPPSYLRVFFILSGCHLNDCVLHSASSTEISFEGVSNIISSSTIPAHGCPQKEGINQTISDSFFLHRYVYIHSTQSETPCCNAPGEFSLYIYIHIASMVYRVFQRHILLLSTIKDAETCPLMTDRAWFWFYVFQGRRIIIGFFYTS
jgi:hypothetical protein